MYSFRLELSSLSNGEKGGLVQEREAGEAAQRTQQRQEASITDSGVVNQSSVAG